MFRLLTLTYLFFLPFRAVAGTTHGHDSILVSSLLRDIASLQQHPPGFFVQGSLEGTRFHASRPDLVRADNNIFFTGLLGVGLKSIRPQLTGYNGRLCDSIIAAMTASFPHYRNKSGRMTYNFWPTDHRKIFPGDPVLSHLTKTHSLPDDADDTAVILSLLDSIPSKEAAAVKALMEAHAGGSAKKIRNYYSVYRRSRVYTTWFGKRMPLDVDFAVECNVLIWVRQAGLTLSAVDSTTAGMLADIIQRRLLLSDPAYVSPHYARTPMLIYQISRLIGADRKDSAQRGESFPGLDSLRPLVISQAWEALGRPGTPLDSVLLASSLIRLGVPPGRIPPITFQGLTEADERFVFFIGTFSDYFPNPFRRLFLRDKLISYQFQCVAYNRFLLLEYLLLSQGREA
jgi:hypothetical protein